MFYIHQEYIINKSLLNCSRRPMLKLCIFGQSYLHYITAFIKQTKKTASWLSSTFHWCRNSVILKGLNVLVEVAGQATEDMESIRDVLSSVTNSFLG